MYSFGSIMLQVCGVSISHHTADDTCDAEQIMSGKVPYHYYCREGQIIAAIFRGETPTRPDIPHVTDHRWEFIRRCWSPFKSVARRPSSDESVAFASDDFVENSLQAV